MPWKSEVEESTPIGVHRRRPAWDRPRAGLQIAGLPEADDREVKRITPAPIRRPKLDRDRRQWLRALLVLRARANRVRAHHSTGYVRAESSEASVLIGVERTALCFALGLLHINTSRARPV